MHTSKARRIALGVVVGIVAAASVPALSASSSGEIAHASLTSNTIVTGQEVEIDWGWLGGSRLRSSSLVHVLANDGSGWSAVARNLPIRNGGYTWDTTQFLDGPYSVRLKIVGQSLKSDVHNIVVDNTAPGIAITRPTTDQVLVDDESPLIPIVAGATTLEAATFDANGVEAVEWYLDSLDSDPIGTGESTVYDFSTTPGPRTVFAVATDTVGLTTTTSVEVFAAPGPSAIGTLETPEAPEVPEGEEPTVPEAPDLGETPDLGELPSPPEGGEAPDPNDPPTLPNPEDLPTILPTP